MSWMSQLRSMEAGKGARERKKPARPRRTVLAIVIVCCRLRWRLARRARSSWTAELVVKDVGPVEVERDASSKILEDC